MARWSCQGRLGSRWSSARSSSSSRSCPCPIYGIQDADDRLAKVYAGQTAFFVSQTLFAVGAIVAAVGFVLLTAWRRSSGREEA
jgi:hypothetical protein